jgi:aryl-alcohol dehydrogenase-like predicted oxidoreductase
VKPTLFCIHKAVFSFPKPQAHGRFRTMTHTLTSVTGRPASPFAFGTMQFGQGASDTDSQAMFDACRAAGVNHFDTAHAYTGGASETLLGGMLGTERDDLLIATKVGNPGGGDAANMRAQFETCRSRLNLDMVDILYLHRFDPNTDLRETMQTFAEFRDKGQIRYVGLSNFAAWQVMKAQTIAAEFDLKIDIFQPMYNLVKRQVEVEILPMCADQGIAVAPYSPLGGGLLTGKYVGAAGGRLVENSEYTQRYNVDWMRQTAQDLTTLAAELGTHPATLAVAWAAAHPTHPMPILSGRNTTQLAPSLDGVTYDMSPDLYKRITALSITPAPATDRLEELA